MGEIFLNGEKPKTYNAFVDERNSDLRKEIIEFLERKGFVLDPDERRGRDAIIEGFLPITFDSGSMEYRMMGNVTCAAAAASQGCLMNREEFYRFMGQEMG